MASVRNVLLIVNPISGGTDKAGLLGVIEGMLVREGIKLCVFQTSGDMDQERVVALARSFQPDRVLVAGGDGTISMVARAIHGLDIVLGIIPAGSSNGLAVDFGIPEAYDEAVMIALGNKVIPMDAVSINGNTSLHMSDMGLNALLVRNYERGDMRGKIGYAREILKTLGEYDYFDVRITTVNEIITANVLIVIIANARKYGTGVNINPKGNVSDGVFELVIGRKLDFLEMAKVFAGNVDVNPEVLQIISLKEAVIECVDKNMHFQIDGEYLGEVNRLNVKILERFVKIAVP